MSFQTLPPEIVAEILYCVKYFTSLLSIIKSCKLTYDTFQSFSNAVVFAILENICIRFTEKYRALRKIPASSKAQREFNRKQSKPISTTAKHYKPLLDTLLIALATW